MHRIMLHFYDSIGGHSFGISFNTIEEATSVAVMIADIKGWESIPIKKVGCKMWGIKEEMLPQIAIRDYGS